MKNYAGLIADKAWAEFHKRIARAVNENHRLVHKGRYLETSIGWGMGDHSFSMEIRNGRIAEIGVGTRSVFTISAPADAWIEFSTALPRPGYQDIFAMIDERYATAEGDLLPFFSNIFYVKGIFGTIRDAGDAS